MYSVYRNRFVKPDFLKGSCRSGKQLQFYIFVLNFGKRRTSRGSHKHFKKPREAYICCPVRSSLQIWHSMPFSKSDRQKMDVTKIEHFAILILTQSVRKKQKSGGDIMLMHYVARPNTLDLQHNATYSRDCHDSCQWYLPGSLPFPKLEKKNGVKKWSWLLFLNGTQL